MRVDARTMGFIVIVSMSKRTKYEDGNSQDEILLSIVLVADGFKVQCRAAKWQRLQAWKNDA